MSSEFLLELLNGNWGIAAAALTIICGMYLFHETISRKIPIWARSRMTVGMRLSIGLFMLSLGVSIRSVEVYLWRSMGTGVRDLSQTWLIVGSLIALIGFLCCIRVISKPLHGNWPWIWTLAAMVIFTIGSIVRQVFF